MTEKHFQALMRLKFDHPSKSFLRCNDPLKKEVINIELNVVKTSPFPAVLIFAGFMLASLASCKKSIPPPQDVARSIVLPENGSSVVQSSNQFAFDFLNYALENDNSGTNKLISPLSIHLALCMAYNGADNDTKTAMQEALRIGNVNTEDLNKTYQAVMRQLPGADNKIQLSIANSIWYRENIQPLQSFQDVTKNYYQASVNPLDFSSTDAVNEINKWVSDNTNGKITQILDRINENDIMYLLNAIYFKGAWKYPFDKNETTNDEFYTQDNNVSTPFMVLRADSLNYLENDSLQMVQLPYGGGNFSMFILLPTSGASLADFIHHFSPSLFETWQAGLRPIKLELHLPKFKFDYAIDDMKPALSDMGMGVAFTDAADFTKMYSQGAKISRAVHKSFIEVNEEGTEAAAVTSIGIVPTAIPGPGILKVNRPFVFVIREKTSGFILFTGVVNDPSQD